MNKDYAGTPTDSRCIAIIVDPMGLCAAIETDSSEALNREITTQFDHHNIKYIARYDDINEKGLRKVLERFHNLDEIRMYQGMSFLDLLHILN